MNVRVRNGMRFSLAVILFLALALAGCGGAEEEVPVEETVKPTQSVNIVLASTTSTQDSGLFDVLIPAFEADNPGIKVQVIAVGTGEALQKGRDGDADVLLVHAKADEEQFVADGFADARFDVMYNDFVIVGPADDPAVIKDAVDAADAFTKIEAADALFVSRGDDSGTHKKELKIWEAASIAPEPDWYKETGQGMGETLKVADEMGAYTLADRATFLALSLDEAIQSQVDFEGAPDLLNQYGVLVVRSARELDAAHAFEKWILSSVGQKIIEDYGVEQYGQPLFFPNAK